MLYQPERVPPLLHTITVLVAVYICSFSWSTATVTNHITLLPVSSVPSVNSYHVPSRHLRLLRPNSCPYGHFSLPNYLNLPLLLPPSPSTTFPSIFSNLRYVTQITALGLLSFAPWFTLILFITSDCRFRNFLRKEHFWQRTPTLRDTIVFFATGWAQQERPKTFHRYFSLFFGV